METPDHARTRIRRQVGKYLSTEIGDLYYEEGGTGLPVVCIHPAGSDCRIWKYFMEEFASNYRVICPDLPAHGKTLPPSGKDDFRVSMDSYANFVHILIRKLHLREVIVVGCSIGGNISLMLATRYPNFLSAIVCADGGGKTNTFPRSSAMTQVADIRNTALRCSSTVSKARLREITWIRNSSPSAIYVGDLVAWNSHDILSELSNIKCPVLMMRGKEDPIFTNKMLNQTGRLIKDCELVELARCGHFPMIERPMLFNRQVRKFLKSRGL